jgi:hypothetical protein
MEKTELDSFQDKFDNVVHKAQKFAVFVRGIEFQKEQIELLERFGKEIEINKEKAIQKKEELVANTLLSLEKMNRALLHELLMLVYLKEDKTNEAWDALVTAQMATKVAIKAHPNGAIHLNGYLQKLHLMEQILFPNQIFFSTGLIAKNSECSICKKEYGTCEHLIGKPYMGKLCVEIVKDVDLKEVSIVSEPADKKCRAYTYKEEGVSKDLMTQRIIEKTKHNN